MSTNVNQPIGFFTLKDIEVVKEQWKNKIEEIKLWREYALKRRENSKLTKFEALLNTLQRFQNKPLYETYGIDIFLRELNSGTYRFQPGKVFYILNPYFGKVRLTYSIPITIQENSKLIRNPKQFLDVLATKLLANKLGEVLNNQEVALPSRSLIIKQLKKKLNNISKTEKTFLILRGDFKDYTLNIPRKTLMEFLNRDLKISPALTKLIDNFLGAGSHFSRKMDNYGVRSLLNWEHLRKGFSKDATFKGLLNIEGIVPGSPLSNILGQLFLVDFDQMMKDIAGKEGFYARYLDDFILIYPLENGKDLKETKKEIVRKIFNFLCEKYKNHPFLKGDNRCRRLETNIVKLELHEKLPHSFEFLGYQFIPNKKEWKISIRYKTIKKFLIKFIYEYSYENYPKKDNKDLITNFTHYLTSKLGYLYRWTFSFIEVNDKRLLDELYKKIILPNLYQEIYKFLRTYYSMNNDKNYSPVHIRRKTKEIVSELKKYFKITLIHRLLKTKKINPQKEIESSLETIEREIERILKKYISNPSYG
jgi:hypothetical protein